jgi:hypothetical protein
VTPDVLRSARQTGYGLPCCATSASTEVLVIDRIDTVAISLVLLGFILGTPLPAAAFPWDQCSTNRDCPPGKPTCSRSFLVLKRCVNICNSDPDCLPNFVCLEGICRNPSVPTSPTRVDPPSGRPAGQATKCNPPDGSKPHGSSVTDAHGKPVGACPMGTTCSQTGFCVSAQ